MAAANATMPARKNAIFPLHVPGEEPVGTADGAAGKVTGSVCGGAPVTLSVLRAAGYHLVFRY